MNKKGFTLMELLVIVLIVAIIVAFARLSYSRSKDVRANEKARSKLVELANAAKLYNEIYPENKIYGSFGQSVFPVGYASPCVLIKGFVSDEEFQDNIASFALNPGEWNAAVNMCNHVMQAAEDYSYILCNPDAATSSSTGQPDSRCKDSYNNSEPKFAIMPTSIGVQNQYTNKYAWITLGQQFGSNYD